MTTEKLDLTTLAGDYNRLAKKQGDFLDNFVKMPLGEGAVTVRILPPKNGIFCQATRIHRINNRSFHCLRELGNMPNSRSRWLGDCPICTLCADLWKRSEETGDIKERNRLRNEYRQLKANERYYYNVIVRKEVDKDGNVRENVGPKILSVGVKQYQKILRAIVGDPALDEDPLGDITDVKIGRDFKIVKRIAKSGDDEFPNYDESKFLDVSPLGTARQIDEWIQAMHDLKSLRNTKTFAELKHEINVYLGLTIDTGESSSDSEPVGNSQPDWAKATSSSTSSAPTNSSTLDEDMGIPEEDFFEDLKKVISDI